MIFIQDEDGVFKGTTKQRNKRAKRFHKHMAQAKTMLTAEGKPHTADNLNRTMRTLSDKRMKSALSGMVAHTHDPWKSMLFVQDEDGIFKGMKPPHVRWKKQQKHAWRAGAKAKEMTATSLKMAKEYRARHGHDVLVVPTKAQDVRVAWADRESKGRAGRDPYDTRKTNKR